MAMRPRDLTFVAAGLGGLFTLLVSVLPFGRFAYRAPSVHVAIETVAALVAMLATYLVIGRFRDSSKLSDLALVYSLAFLALASLFLSAVPAAAANARPDRFSTWAALAAGLIGAATFALSAFASDRRLRRPSRTATVWLGFAVAVGATLAVTIAELGSRLPQGIQPGLSPEGASRPRIVGEAGVLIVQLAAMALFAAAAVGFTRRSERTGDELLRWFGAGAALAAFARLNYFLFPSLYSQWVYTGDVLRLGFYTLVLVGATREIGLYRRALAEAAILEERRRMARDLHDGLAQELAFIATQARHLSLRSAAMGRVAAAAERALDESRRAIVALTGPVHERLDVVLAQAAEEAAGRVGTRLKLELEEVDVSPDKREALLRIVREAVTNAARHGGASLITVSLANGNGVDLRVVDDGRGFDPSRPRKGGFGLISMRERAEALGAEFKLSSEPGAGTEVAIRLP